MFKLALSLILFLAGQFAGANEFFPRDYADSRSRFRAACAVEAKNVFCKTFVIPSHTDRDLTMDVGYFGGRGRSLVILQSGIHGVETPAGAAVQQLFLERHLHTYLQNGIDVLLVHAVNPHGFKYGRRTDENNIDLNRNFTLDPALYWSRNRGYARMRPTLEPEGQVSSILRERMRIEAAIVFNYALSGFDRAQAHAIITGQYDSPKGLSYGGERPTPQVPMLWHLFRETFQHYQQILMLDVHTGLGAKGELSMIPSTNSNEVKLEELAALFSSVKGVKPVDFSVDEKFYAPKGDVTDFVVQLAPADACVAALSMEYGTLGNSLLHELETVSRLVLENQVHFNGCRNEAVCARVKTSFLELFNPSDWRWRNAVTTQADGLFQALVHSL